MGETPNGFLKVVGDVDAARDAYVILARQARGMRLHRLTFLCPHGCVLLDAIATPEGMLVHRPVAAPASDKTPTQAVRQVRDPLDGSGTATTPAPTARPSTFFADILSWDDDLGEREVLECVHLRAELKPSDFRSSWQRGGQVKIERR